MNGWRGTWARAQITGVVFSSLVWIVVAGLSIPALAVILAIGVAAVTGRNTRAMLWWRFGATSTDDFRGQAILAAIVHVASLRGRSQPSTWIGRRLAGGDAVMPTRTDLVVSSEFLRQVLNGQLTDRQASAIVSQALGHTQVRDSTMVNAIDAYCLPWHFVEIFTGLAGQIARRSPALGFAWEIRWIVFGAAAFDAYRNARWAALVGVVLIAVISWSTSHFQKRWVWKLRDLGAQRAIAEGLAPDLADPILLSDSSSPSASASSVLAGARRAGQ